MASDLLAKEIINRITAESKLKDQEFDLSHGVAAFFASKFSKLEQDTVAQIQGVLKPILAVTTESIDKFILPPAQLSELSSDTVYFYSRYITASLRLKASLRLFEVLLEPCNFKAIDASAFHSIFQAYRGFAEASGILRASFRSVAAVSDDYSLKCLLRSYAAQQKDLRDIFDNMPKLEKARQVIQQTAEANIVVESDIPQVGRS